MLDVVDLVRSDGIFGFLFAVLGPALTLQNLLNIRRYVDLDVVLGLLDVQSVVCSNGLVADSKTNRISALVGIAVTECLGQRIMVTEQLPRETYHRVLGHQTMPSKKEFCGKFETGHKKAGKAKDLQDVKPRMTNKFVMKFCQRSTFEYGIHLGATVMRPSAENVAKQLAVKSDIKKEKGRSSASRAQSWAKEYGGKLQRNGLFVIWKDFCSYVSYKMLADPYENGHDNMYEWLEMDRWERRVDEYRANNPNVKLDKYSVE